MSTRENPSPAPISEELRDRDENRAGERDAVQDYLESHGKEKCHADEYRGSDQLVYLIAVEFSKDARNVATFEVERA